jgi:hypothetical protein
MKEFLFLIIAALALYYLKWPLLLIAALTGFFAALYWLTSRFPRTMVVIVGFLSGLLGGGRR